MIALAMKMDRCIFSRSTALLASPIMVKSPSAFQSAIEQSTGVIVWANDGGCFKKDHFEVHGCVPTYVCGRGSQNEMMSTYSEDQTLWRHRSYHQSRSNRPRRLVQNSSPRSHDHIFMQKRRSEGIVPYACVFLCLQREYASLAARRG